MGKSVITITNEIKIKSDLLQIIPDHIILKIVESALNQLQIAYVSAQWNNAEIFESSKKKKKLCKYTYSEQSVLEFFQPTEDENHGIDKAIESAFLKPENLFPHIPRKKKYQNQ